MTKKLYNNKLTKPRQEDYRDRLIESERLKLKKLQQEELESNRREIATFRGGYNVGD